LLENGFGRWIKAFLRNEAIYGLVRDFPSEEKIILEAQNILHWSLFLYSAGTDGGVF